MFWELSTISGGVSGGPSVCILGGLQLVAIDTSNDEVLFLHLIQAIILGRVISRRGIRVCVWMGKHRGES